ncbi:hypothetical protein tb265_17560 [Gemmatimonadetes bacterium T265]|nr:hypothetical protein tb265_17560 [Gemmatimonadetes bacterium T265]
MRPQPFHVVDRTAARAPAAWAGAPGAGALGAFLGRPRRLPTWAGTYATHRASPRLPVPPALARALRALHGKLVVLNPGHAASLPPGVASAARGLLRGDFAAPRRAVPPYTAALGRDTRTDTDERRAREVLDALPPSARAPLARAGAQWRALVLCEPTRVVIARAPGDGPAFAAAAAYRLVLVAGTGAPPAAPPLDDATLCAPAGAPAAGTPAAWFTADVLLPDTAAFDAMTPDAAAAYARLTGRAGAASGAPAGGAADRYWFAPAWERFEERGRVVGHVTPAFLARRAARPGASSPAHLSPAHDRGSLVPPGYCLVRVRASLELAVVGLA